MDFVPRRSRQRRGCSYRRGPLPFFSDRILRAGEEGFGEVVCMSEGLQSCLERTLVADLGPADLSEGSGYTLDAPQESAAD